MTAFTQPLTVGGLFSGIGGFELGFSRAGFDVAWMVEKDEFCQRVLKHHAPEYWPNAKVFNDVKEVGQHNLTAVSVITGGFPCQPHSLAGQRRGAADDRDLWPEYRRIITELRPAWVIGENVPGIITTILDQVLSDLEGLGYAWQAFVIPACAFDAPHRRDRVWIVAHSERYRRRRWDYGNEGGDSREVQTTRSRTRKKPGILAHTDGERRGQRWQSESEYYDAQQGGQTMAHATQQPKREQANEPDTFAVGGEARDEFSNSGQFLAHPKSLDDGYGVNGDAAIFRSATAGREPESAVQPRERRPTQPGLGRTPDGLPARLDGYWGGDWERDTPRTAAGVPNRVNRLKALGNAVIPQIPEFFANLIKEVEQC